MTAQVSKLAALPFWPRFLSKEQAAAYVGVSATLFMEEVELGMWPPPVKRGFGEIKPRLTWDKHALDTWADGWSPHRDGGTAYQIEQALRDADEIARQAREERSKPRKRMGVLTSLRTK